MNWLSSSMNWGDKRIAMEEKEEEKREEHKADRVPGFFSSSSNWDPPPSQPQARVCPPTPGSGGRGDTIACGRGGVEDPNWDEGTDTMVIGVIVHIKK
jgi:hypothetical protein